MSFRIVATVTAAILLVLGVGYLFAGALLVARWQIEPTESVLLFGRRIGAVYVGLAVMFFLARTVPASLARTALSTGAFVVCSLLSALGAWEFAAGRSGPGILASACVEALLAVAYAGALVRDRRAGGRRAPAQGA